MSGLFKLALAVGVAVVIGALAMLAHTDPAPYKAPPSRAAVYTDTSLYRAITARVQAGQHYYAAAEIEQRTHGYPTTPAVTFREPTLIWFLALLHFEILRWTALFGVAGAAVIAVHRRMESLGLPMFARVGGTLLATTGIANAGMLGAPYLHEVWAALLVCISIAIWRPDRYWPSVVLAFVACLLREIALPFLVVMIACADQEKRWRELAAWTAAIGLFLALYVVHLWYASKQPLPGDIVSDGWVKFGGWRFIIATARRNLALALLPGEAISVALSLCLLGLLGARDEWGRRLAFTVLAFAATFLVIGRPQNYYWGTLYAPLFPLGLLYLPAALRKIVERPGATALSHIGSDRKLRSLPIQR